MQVAGDAPGSGDEADSVQRVLLVEDDNLQAKLITRSIERLGANWKVVRVASGEECLTQLESRPFAVAILDLVLPALPGLTGLDILRQIRARGWAIATILATSHGSEAVAIEALRLGVSDYVKKEEGYLDELPMVIQRVVREYRQRMLAASSYSRLRVELARKTHRGLLDSFAAPIVHDIKNPLTKIIGMSEMLLERGAAMDLNRAASIILRGANTIDKLVSRLLMFAKKETEPRATLDLGEFLGKLMAAEADQLRPQNIRLVRKLPDKPVRVRAAAGAMEQVFLNLVANASEVLTQTKGGGTITVEVIEGEGHATVKVTDDGPGIPPEILPEIFKPYATFGKGSRGTGLGLMIVSEIVHRHGGTISVDNGQRGGACFSVALPTEDHGLVALILDDDETVQDLIQGQLARLGVRGESYMEGSQVLSLLPSGRWDLVILDIKVPGVGGTEVFQEIIRQRPDLEKRTMIISGCIDDQPLQELLSGHPVPCLPKPYTTGEFSEVVRMLLKEQL